MTWGSGGITPPYFTSALDGDEFSASRPGLFTPIGRAPGTNWIGGYMGSGPVWTMWRRENRLPTKTRTPNPWLSSPVNCCWFSPAKSFLVSGSVGTHDKSFVRSKTIHVFGNTLSSSTRGEVGLWESALQLFLRNFAQSCPHSHIIQVGALVLCAHRAPFFSLLSWMEFMQHIRSICQCRL
jgi:hypothetical protein